MTDPISSRRTESLTAVVALFLLLGLIAALASCGNSDLVLGGSGVVTATDSPTPTDMPTS